MIKDNQPLNKNKHWSIGSIVSVGWLKNLRVVDVRAEKDGMPDIYTLESARGIRYEFIPHHGIHRI